MPHASHPPLASAAPVVRNDRQNAVLQAAEKLFAMHGYHAVTIRQIASEAGVPSALVGYYFGRKQDLFQAIFAHRQSMHAERFRALDAVAAASGSTMALPRLVKAFVQPLVRWRQNPADAHHALLLAREIARPARETAPVLQAFVDPLATRFIEALSDMSPGSSRDDAAWAYRFTLGALLHHLADERDERPTGQGTPQACEAGVDRLVEFIVGGVRAVLDRPARAVPTVHTAPLETALP